MSKPNLQLAMRNAEMSILEGKFTRAMSKMTPDQQKEFMQKVMTEVPEMTVEETPAQEA